MGPRLGPGCWGAGFGWFFLGGIVGFGFGGVAMFQSLPRRGSNLSTLIVQCGSALVALVGEWLRLGTRLPAASLAWVAVTLGGLVVALLPRSLPRAGGAAWTEGLLWAFLSALGQGGGAVISRKAFALAAAFHELIDPGTAAYQRGLGGLLFGALAWVALIGRVRPPRPPLGSPWPWVVANALTGPVLGVTCFQWVLRSTPAGIVQPIVAAAPLLTIPFAARLEGSRPRAPYYLGALLAIAGVTGLFLWR